MQVPFGASPGQRQQRPQAAQQDVGSAAPTQLFQDAPAGLQPREGGSAASGVVPMAAGSDPQVRGLDVAHAPGPSGMQLVGGMLPPAAQHSAPAAGHSGLNGAAHVPIADGGLPHGGAQHGVTSAGGTAAGLHAAVPNGGVAGSSGAVGGATDPHEVRRTMESRKALCCLTKVPNGSSGVDTPASADSPLPWPEL